MIGWVNACAGDETSCKRVVDLVLVLGEFGSWGISSECNDAIHNTSAVFGFNEVKERHVSASTSNQINVLHLI